MSRKPDKRPRKLRVMADYGSSGIWASGGMIEHCSLGLPPALARRFTDWIEEYTSPLENPGHVLDTQTFSATGRTLAGELKRFLGSEYEIVYFPEKDDGSLGAAEFID